MKKYYLYVLFLVQGLYACSDSVTEEVQENEMAQINKEEEHPLHRRMVEDVPVEDRKYLTDTTIVLAKASRKSRSKSSVISSHKMKKTKLETGTYYLVAGTFKGKKEAQLLVNYFETEGLSTLILPHKGMQRVAIKMKADEKTARARLDSLNLKYEGIIEFWFYQG